MLGRVGRFAQVFGIAAILMLPTATTALAADLSIRPVSGHLIAKGVEVDVTVSFTCPAGDTVPPDQGGGNGGLFAFAQQAVSKTQQASGSGSGGGQTCTGLPQTAVLAILSNVSGPPFRVGPAVVNAFITACDASACTFTSSGLTAVRFSMK